MKKMGVGKSHSKIILMGEHSVVYGYPALALPLKTIGVTCRIFPARSPLQRRGDALSKAISLALDYLDQGQAPIRFRVQSQIPSKRGMGSSAAVSIAAIRAVFDYFQADLEDHVLEDLVMQAEQVAHLNPSGLDAKTCLSDQAISFTKGVGFNQLAVDLDAYLLIVDTGIYGQTKEAVKKVADLGPKKDADLAALGQLCEAMEEQIRQKDLQQMGQIMNQAHHHLSQLGVSIKEVDELVETARKEGALGAKMTGGGLGGCILALVRNEKEAKRLAHVLSKKGAVHTWIEKLSV